MYQNESENESNEEYFEVFDNQSIPHEIAYIPDNFDRV